MMIYTKETNNYRAIAHLAVDVACATLQEKLMCCFPGLSFEDILNQEKHNILHLWLPENKCCCPSGTGSVVGSTKSKKSQRLSELQCNLMFDHKPASPCSNKKCCCKYVAKTNADPSVLDVTLKSCLLLNITNISDSERIIIRNTRQFRNDLHGHVTKTTISDDDFQYYWPHLSRTIKDLAAACSPSYSSRVQTIIKKLESEYNLHRIRILKRELNDSEVSSRLDQVLQNTVPTEKQRSIKDEMKGLIKDLQMHPHVDQRNREIKLSTMELDTNLKNSKFIETRAFHYAVKKIKNEKIKGPLVFLGLPGDGKTTHASRLIQMLMNGHNFQRTRKQPLIIHGESECNKVKLIDPDTNIVVFIDDMYGKYSVPRQTEETWKGCFLHMEACFSDTSSSTCNVLIVAMRKDIYKICKDSLNDLPIFKSSVIIDLTCDDFRLTQEEKMAIFRTYVSLSCIDDNQAQEICEENNQIGFPQCCRFYSENENLQVLKADFFKYPTRYLKEDLKKMLDGSDREKQRFCVLVLIMLHGGCLKVEQCFEDSSSEKEIETVRNAAMVCNLKYSENLGNNLLKDAKSFLGVYVKCNEDEGQYLFSHDFVEQTVVNIMFEENAHFMIKHSKIENFSQLTSDPERHPSVFKPEKCHYKPIVERISKEVKDEQYKIFTTLANLDLWNEEEFRDQFSVSVRLEDIAANTGDNMSLLECGAKAGNYHLVKYLCSYRCDRDIVKNALDTAGRFGQEKVFSVLYEQEGIEPNIRTFFCVIKSGNMSLFKLLLESKIEFHEHCRGDFLPFPISAFEQISLTGNLEMAQEFVSKFPALFESQDIYISLYLAGFSGSKAFVEYLVDLGAILEVSGVLHSASQSGSIDLVKYLIEDETRFNVTQLFIDNMTILNTACLSGKVEMVRYLVERFPDLLHVVSKLEQTNLQFACFGGSVDVVKYLTKQKVDVYHVSKDRETVLHFACLSGKLEVVKYLVENHPGLITMVDESKMTVLHYACKGGSVDVVKYLIKKGVNVYDVAIDRRTVLQSACLKNKLKVVKYLVKNHRGLLDKVDEKGQTNLHYACLGGSVAVVKYLIKKGMDINIVARDKKTVLHSACSGNKIDIVKYLVQNYPDLLYMVDERGKTNIDFATDSDSFELIEYLEERNTNVKVVAVVMCLSLLFYLICSHITGIK